MTLAVAGVLCLFGGTIVAAALIAVLWILSPQKLRFLYIPWLALVWMAALLGALALLGYGIALLTQGPASLSAVFLYTGFLISFTVSVSAAPRLLLIRYGYVTANTRSHYLAMVLLVVYAALVFLWVPGTLMAALTPFLATAVSTWSVLWSRQNTRVMTSSVTGGATTPRKDLLYWSALMFSAIGLLIDWAMCTIGARDYLLPIFLAVHAAAVNGYLYALPVY